MPKIDLRFLDCLSEKDYVKVKKTDSDDYEEQMVVIEISEFRDEYEGFVTNLAYLDKSTAIRFSKALRTAINQIK